ncbi:thermonuclease family protein [Amycolatopsis sp. GM8]|uniref:thermonuclease family protein n=1 Tax=Amycolatopsis sp. GM8 TaxID=2896530 RepID=UPI001F2939A5|nr:thermonuclease family protein [Amycolatopsis sp. GM8]
MPLTLIKGSYRIVGASPDGDSVRFYPDDPEAFSKAHLRVRLNSRGGVQLRLDGIDALETHYQAQNKGGQWRQPVGPDAAASLLSHLGFRTVERDGDGTVTAATPEQVPGHIMTRFADKYGRAVAFAFPGQRSGRTADGGDVHLDVRGMRASANYSLLEAGLVYPTFYSLLYIDLRNAMSKAAVAAREAGKGLWAQDSTVDGFKLSSRKQLREDLVILPKLFRRLVDYLGLDETGGVSLAGFANYLDTRDDRLVVVSTGQTTEFATLVKVRRQTIQLTVPPEDIVFAEG